MPLCNFGPVSLPFTDKFPDRSQTSNVVAEFQLKANKSQPKFQVNFRKNEDNNADTVLHVNPRPTDGGYKLVLNTTTHAPDKWQQESVHDLGHFSPGAETTLTINLNATSFTVKLNGVQCVFAHRDPNTLNMINYMHIDGDIQVTGMCFAFNG